MDFQSICRPQPSDTTCTSLGLPACTGCLQSKYGSRCWVAFYTDLVMKDDNSKFKLYIFTRLKQSGKIVSYPKYFVAALKLHPEKLAIYEKLMVLA